MPGMSFVLHRTTCISASLVGAILLLASSVAAAYSLRRTYDASNFADAFIFRTAADYPEFHGDPTHGFVDYVDAATARTRGLFRVTAGQPKQVFLGVDNATQLRSGSRGRGSLRLESRDTFDDGLLVVDIAHMPGGQCGVWPALWTYNFDEDPMGEIDMIEGINHQTDNVVSLHTCDRCHFTAGPSSGRLLPVPRKPGSRQPASSLASRVSRESRSTGAIMTGTDLRSNCALGGDCQENSVNGDGCGVTATDAASYGDAFNAAGGGLYVLQLEPGSGSRGSRGGVLRIWHFRRDHIPPDIPADHPDPDTWGLPMGAFEQQYGGCDVGRIFRRQTLIINIDFCGDNESDDIWQSDRACRKYASCQSFVAGHPEAFGETYWLINSVRLYQRDV